LSAWTVNIAVQNRFGGCRFVQQGDQRRQLLGAAGVHPPSHGAGPEVHAIRFVSPQPM
jgi:hypothetical protein